MICPHCGHLNLPGSDSCERCVLDLAPLDKPAGQNRIEKSLLENQVADLTLKPPVTVPRGASVHDAMRTMVATGVGAVMVVDESEKLIGIFTERDLLRRVAGLRDDFKAVRVEEVMTRHPETVSMDDALAFVLHKMDVGGYRHLPVVTDGKAESIVSVRGMIRHIVKLCGER